MTAQEIADALNITINQVRDLRSRRVFPPAKDKAPIEVHEEALRTFEANSRQGPLRRTDKDTSALLKSRTEKEAALARKAGAEAEKAERALALARGDTVPASDMIEAIQDIQRAVHHTFGDLAPMLAAQVGLTPRQQAATERIVERLRAQIRRTIEAL